MCAGDGRARDPGPGARRGQQPVARTVELRAPAVFPGTTEQRDEEDRQTLL